MVVNILIVGGLVLLVGLFVWLARRASKARRGLLNQRSQDAQAVSRQIPKIVCAFPVIELEYNAYRCEVCWT